MVHDAGCGIARIDQLIPIEPAGHDRIITLQQTEFLPCNRDWRRDNNSVPSSKAVVEHEPAGAGDAMAADAA